MDEGGCGRKPKQEKEMKMKHDELNGTLSPFLCSVHSYTRTHAQTLGFQCVDVLTVLCVCVCYARIILSW